MESLESALRPEERTSLRLRSLYGRHGYRQYKVSKFEEYDLYAHNKRFSRQRFGADVSPIPTDGSWP